MSEVSSFAKNTQAVIKDTDTIMKDIPASCQRVHFYTQKLGKAQCQKQDEVYTKFLNITRVLSAYSAQLDVLASDELIDASQNFDSLEASLNENEKLKPEEAKAIVSLSELLASSLTQGKREDQLSYYLYEADESVQKLLHTLSKAIKRNYLFELNTERAQLKSYHNKLALIGKKQEFIAWEMYRSQLYEKENVLSEKIELAKRVANALDSAAKVHKKLTLGSDDLTKKELKNYLKDFSKELKPVFKDMKNVYKSYKG